mmetsp:Transcript_27727/g.52174  ORF Transcript_27727/g.52174 Transcript_27727/m.52174 type:complete len:1142 (+) Transcript_27727:67-3492(+)
MSSGGFSGTPAPTSNGNTRRPTLHARVEPIRVAVRLRPLREDANAPLARRSVWHTERSGNQQCICLSPGALRAVQNAGGRGGSRTPPSPGPGIPRHVPPYEGARFNFDICFDGKTPNQEVFQTAARDVIRSSHEGVNATVLAYGQTNSGKTHSILGTLREPGVLPLTMHELFEVEDSARIMAESVARVSYFEIFNERVIDLLSPQGTGNENVCLPVKEDVDRGFYVQGLSETPVRTAEDALRLVERGEERRRYAQTRWNEYSSRSHVLFTLTLERLPQYRPAEAPNAAPVMVTPPGVPTKVSIVDLAGCENHKFEQSEDGRYINRSLFFLGEVISRLCSGPSRIPRPASRRHSRETTPTRGRPGSTGPASGGLGANSFASDGLPGSASPIGGRRVTEADGAASPVSGEGRSRSPSRSRERSEFIPYRDSKLTRILRSSLGGNAVTLLLVTVHPAFQFIEQSMTSLRFATKARSVENLVSDAGPQSVDEKNTIDVQQKIIEGLQQKLRSLELERSPQRWLSPEPTSAATAEMWQKLSAKGMPDGDFRGYIDQCILAQFRGLRHELEEKEQQLAAKTRLLSEREMQLGQLREQLEAGTGLPPGSFGSNTPPAPHGVPAASERVLGGPATSMASAVAGTLGASGPSATVAAGPSFADSRRAPTGPHGVPSVRERAQGPAAVAAARAAVEEFQASVPAAPPAPASVPDPVAITSVSGTSSTAGAASAAAGQAATTASAAGEEPTAFQQVQSRAEDIVCLRSSQRYITRQQMPMSGTAPAASDPSVAPPPAAAPPASSPFTGAVVATFGAPLVHPPLATKLAKTTHSCSASPVTTQAEPAIGNTLGLAGSPSGDALGMGSGSPATNSGVPGSGLTSTDVSMSGGSVRAMSSTAPVAKPAISEGSGEAAPGGNGSKSQKDLVEKLLYLAVKQINSVKTGSSEPAEALSKEASVAKPGSISWDEPPQGGPMVMDGGHADLALAAEGADSRARHSDGDPDRPSRSGSAEGSRSRRRPSVTTPPLAMPPLPTVAPPAHASDLSVPSAPPPVASQRPAAPSPSRSWDLLADWRWSASSREDLPPPSNPNVECTPRKEAELEPRVDFVDLEITRRTTTPPQPFGIGRPAREFNHAWDSGAPQSMGQRRIERA